MIKKEFMTCWDRDFVRTLLSMEEVLLHGCVHSLFGKLIRMPMTVNEQSVISCQVVCQ